MSDPVEYINEERLKELRKTLDKRDIEDLLELFEYDIRLLPIDALHRQHLLDIMREIKKLWKSKK